MTDNERTEWLNARLAINNKPVKVEVRGGMGFCSLLTIIFITLKLIGKIAWSWWWVLSPMWIPTAIILAILVLTVVLAVMFGSK